VVDQYRALLPFRPTAAALLHLKIDEQKTLMREYIPQIGMNFHLINKYIDETFESVEAKNVEADKTYEQAAHGSDAATLRQFQDEKEARARAAAESDLTYMVLEHAKYSPDEIVITQSDIDEACLGQARRLPIRSELHGLIMTMANEGLFHTSADGEQPRRSMIVEKPMEEVS
jgi:hypothetical protein